MFRGSAKEPIGRVDCSVRISGECSLREVYAASEKVSRDEGDLETP
jgi:hypothetical protein